MADTTYVTIPELTEITRAETTDTAMLETAVEDQLTPTGYGSRRITLSSIASYVLSNFSSLSLGGVTRTVKAAIDAIATLLGSSSMGTTATTVTGAVSEVNTKANTNADNITTLTNSVNDLNSNFNTFKAFSIPSNTDLNTLTSEGFYYSLSSAVSATLINTPVTGSAFVMLVMRKGQTYTHTIFTGIAIFSRTATSSGWGGWYKYNGTAV